MPVVACSKCGTRNRVDPRHAAEQIAKCGKCGTPLDLSKVEDTTDGSKPLIVTDDKFSARRDSVKRAYRCWSTAGRPGAAHVAWSVQSWTNWLRSRRAVIASRN